MAAAGYGPDIINKKDQPKVPKAPKAPKVDPLMQALALFDLPQGVDTAGYIDMLKQTGQTPKDLKSAIKQIQSDLPNVSYKFMGQQQQQKGLDPLGLQMFYQTFVGPRQDRLNQQFQNLAGMMSQPRNLAGLSPAQNQFFNESNKSLGQDLQMEGNRMMAAQQMAPLLGALSGQLAGNQAATQKDLMQQLLNTAAMKQGMTPNVGGTKAPF